MNHIGIKVLQFRHMVTHMAVIHGKSRLKSSGGKYKAYRKKRKHELGSQQIEIKLGTEKKKIIRTRGNNTKSRLLVAEYANVYNPADKKTTKAKIKTVKENKANKDYIRRNVVTKGALLDTEVGTTRVTSRPGQCGIVNAVLCESK